MPARETRIYEKAQDEHDRVAWIGKKGKTRNYDDGLNTEHVLSVNDLREQMVPQRPFGFCKTTRRHPWRFIASGIPSLLFKKVENQK